MLNEELRQKLRDADFIGQAGVKILLKSGDIVEVEDVRFSPLNGGEIHIIAGPTEDEKFDEDDEDTSSAINA